MHPRCSVHRSDVAPSRRRRETAQLHPCPDPVCPCLSRAARGGCAQFTERKQHRPLSGAGRLPAGTHPRGGGARGRRPVSRCPGQPRRTQPALEKRQPLCRLQEASVPPSPLRARCRASALAGKAGGPWRAAADTGVGASTRLPQSMSPRCGGGARHRRGWLARAAAAGVGACWRRRSTRGQDGRVGNRVPLPKANLGGGGTAVGRKPPANRALVGRPGERHPRRSSLH